MRIAWFTPFGTGSAIGMVSRQICEKLNETEDVEIWTVKSDSMIDTSVKTVTFKSSDDLERLNKYDFLIYNMGNFAGNHRDIYEVSQKYPGIVICHDQNMSGFFGQYYTFPEYGADPVNGTSAYTEHFRKYYGNAAAKEAENAVASGHYPVYDFQNLSRYDFINATINNSIGVFTHARFFCDRIKSYYNKAVAYTYLPCIPKKVEDCDDSTIKSIIREAKQNKKTVIVSNGIVHPVKHIDKLVSVLEDDPELAEKTVYLVIGSYGGEYGDKLAQSASGRLKGCLYMMNYQPYEVMDYALQNADLCVNLRYPNSEVCSLSLFEQMSFGKPVVVINSGVYGEMPDNAVIKLNYENVYEELRNVLVQAVNGSLSNSIGENARSFILDNCSIEKYCSNLLSYLSGIKDFNTINSFQERIINGFKRLNSELGITGAALPSTFDHNVNGLFDLMNYDESSSKKCDVIGVWAAFAYKVPNLNREGISKFMNYMISAMASRYHVSIEVWCYSFNEEEMRIIFSEIPKDRIKFITEENWADVLDARADAVQAVGTIKENKDNLNVAARLASRADVMLPLIVYLDSVLGTGKRVFVPAHDMAVAYHFDDFVSKDKNYKFIQSDILSRAENLARNGAVFFSNSNTVREKQILKYVRCLRPENAHVVYLPVNIPEGIDENLLSETEVREKFGITGRYMFYPTQVRPYKNFILLIKALDLLKKRGIKISLVITGNLEDVPSVKEEAERLNIEKQIIKLNSVSEYELYSIYKYADATPVPSLFEGGFPWQACEALFMNVPLALSNIDVVDERIRVYGFEPDNCGLEIFDPYNETQLADCLERLLADRSRMVQKQRIFAEKLLQYSWDNAVDEYYRLFTEY